jgi:hypothetical protein
MVLPFKNSPVVWSAFPFLILLAVIALPLQHHYDGPSISSGIFVAGQAKLKTVLPQQKDKVEIVSVADWLDLTPKIDPSLLRVDLKQNLLVWPNIAGDLTRAPPAAFLFGPSC